MRIWDGPACQDKTQKSSQPCDQQAEIVAGCGEGDVDGVAGAAAQLALDLVGHAPFLARGVEP